MRTDEAKALHIRVTGAALKDMLSKEIGTAMQFNNYTIKTEVHGVTFV